MLILLSLFLGLRSVLKLRNQPRTFPKLSGLLRQRLHSFPVDLPVHHISATSLSLIIQNYLNHFLYGSVMSKHCNWWGSIVSCSSTTQRAWLPPNPSVALFLIIYYKPFDVSSILIKCVYCGFSGIDSVIWSILVPQYNRFKLTSLTSYHRKDRIYSLLSLFLL